MILSVDPGVRGCGVALWVAGQLHAAVYVVGSKEARRPLVWGCMADAVKKWADAHASVTTVISEFPQVYREVKLKGDPNDLLDLAAVVAAIMEKFQSAQKEVFLPRAWKQTCPKEIHHERIRKRLTSEEFSRVALPAKSLQHNVWDAVGLGLFYARRM